MYEVNQTKPYPPIVYPAGGLGGGGSAVRGNSTKALPGNSLVGPSSDSFGRKLYVSFDSFALILFGSKPVRGFCGWSGYAS